MRLLEIIDQYRHEIQKLGIRTNELEETIKAVPYRPSDWLVENYPDAGDWREAEVRYNKQRINDLFLIIDELRRRIPVVPSIAKNSVFCPECDAPIDGYEDQPSYCPNCGQAIEWLKLPDQEVE